MKLSAFILTRREAILADWEQDARGRIGSAPLVGIDEWRDHLGELLDTVARDLEDGSRTMGPPSDDGNKQADQNVEAVGEKHGARRAEQGLVVSELVAEFPVLRLCVQRLWIASLPSVSMADLDSLIRFDTAIDRALTQSVKEYMERLDQSRETLLGILGHDLRDPLATVIAGGALLADDAVDEATTREVARSVVSTGKRMHHMVVDLLDATRTRFGGRMPIHKRDADLGETVRSIVKEFAASHPDRHVDVSVVGDLRGQWDDKRLGQAVGNLLANALRYGKTDTPIRVSAAARDEILIAVHNDGPAIPDDRRALLFEPWANIDRGGTAARDPGHPGLGLYIANTIVVGHGGHIDVESTAEHGTTFTIHLPKSAATGS